MIGAASIYTQPLWYIFMITMDVNMHCKGRPYTLGNMLQLKTNESTVSVNSQITTMYITTNLPIFIEVAHSVWVAL